MVLKVLQKIKFKRVEIIVGRWQSLDAGGRVEWYLHGKRKKLAGIKAEQRP